MDNGFSEEYRQHIINLRKINFEGYKYWIDNGWDEAVTFEEFLLIRLDSQKEMYDKLMELFKKHNPSIFKGLTEIGEEIFNSLEKWDKIEKEFKEEYL